MITTHHTYQLAAVFAYAAQRLRAEGDVAAADFAHKLYQQVVARAEAASNVGGEHTVQLCSRYSEVLGLES